MESNISVCIPAYNEARTIESTLNSIVNQTLPASEILVCANACEDDTAKIVKNYSSKYPQVSLIETAQRGKPNAWNILRENASNNHLFFCDGDVCVQKDALRYLDQSLKYGGKIAYGAIIKPNLSSEDFLTRCLATRGLVGCLVGRLYAFDNKKLSIKMNQCGFEKMPLDLIADDNWLSLIIGKNQWAIDERAIVNYSCEHWKEEYDMILRYARSSKQIKEDYKFLLDSCENLDEKKIRWFHKLINTPSNSEKLEMLIGFILKKSMYQIAKFQVALENEPIDGRVKWEISQHSKTPIINN
jgi:glycosyltransferase involved in cell wall biosynthesis